MTRNFKAVAALISLLLFSATAMAQDEKAAEGWHGKGELGFVRTTGNTETSSLNLALEFIYEKGDWRHTLGGAALRSEKNGDVDAERWTVYGQSDRKLNDRSYLFGSARYESDKFAGFDPVTSLAAGYGYQLIKNEKHSLLGEVGVGYRTQEVADTGKSEDGVIFRGRLDYAWKVSDSTAFGNLTLIESGSDNTFIQNDTSLNVAINAKFGVRLAYQYRHNSGPPLGKEGTDTQFTTNLVYNF